MAEQDQDSALARALLEALAPADDEVFYAVVDAARNGMAAVRDLDPAKGERLQSLFTGEMAPHLGGVAPYLVQLGAAPARLNGWAEQWGGSIGILLVAEACFETMWDHLREVLIAEDEDGKQFFFRFYDPRVLRTYLPSCTPDETAEFFGPVRRIVVEAEDPREALVCTPGDSGVVVRAVPSGLPAEPAEAGAGEGSGGES